MPGQQLHVSAEALSYHRFALAVIQSATSQQTSLKEHLLEYTQTFAHDNIPAHLRRDVAVSRVRFNYDTECWEPRTYSLPWLDGTPNSVLRF